MCFQRAGFPLPEKKLLYQNTDRTANGWFETESVVNNEILKSQICYRRTDSDQQFTEYDYGAIYYGRHETSWSAQPYVTLHELCHYAHHGIEKLSEIERKEYSFNKDIAKMVSEYAMKHYVEFIAESLAMLFFSGQFDPDFKENSLMYITKELPQADSNSHKAFITPYNKLCCDRQFLSSQAQSFLCYIKRYALGFDDDSTRSNRCNPSCWITFTFTHTHISRLTKVLTIRIKLLLHLSI